MHCFSGASVHAIDVHEHDIVTKRIENYNACIIAWHRGLYRTKECSKDSFYGENISRAKRGKIFLISNLFSLNLGPSETQKHLKLCFQFLKIP